MAKNRIECAPLFFENVSKWLGNAVIHPGWENRDFKRISGSVVTSICTARIEILFRPNHLKSCAPIVFCDEEWIRKEIDWHCFKNKLGHESWKDSYRLCWIHPYEWTRAHYHQLKRLPSVIEEGSSWLKNNISKLLERHWIGHILGIKTWKPEWGGWAHGDRGSKEFLNECKMDGMPYNWERR